MEHKEERTELTKFFIALKYARLTKQQRKTLMGQAIAGDFEGALKGFQRLTEAKQNNGKQAM